MDTVHVTIESMLHCKRATTAWPVAHKVLGTSVCREMLVQLVLGDEGLCTARTLEGLVTRVRVNVPYQLIRGWK